MSNFGMPPVDDFIAVTPAQQAANAGYFEQADAHTALALASANDVAADPNSGVVFILRGTPYGNDRAHEALQRCGFGPFEHYRPGESRPPDRTPPHLRHIGKRGEFKPDTGTAQGFGVLHPARLGRIYELAPGFGLREILRRIERDSFAACELPDSVSIVGGGSVDCTGHATGFAIANEHERKLFIVWRCCVPCADYLRSCNRDRARMAESSSHNAEWRTT